VPFLLVAVLLALVWFAILVPQRRRQRAHMAMQDSVEVGDEIITAGGMYGEVTRLGEGDVTVRIAPELEVRVARRAVAGVTQPELEADTETDRPDPTPGT